MSQYLETSLYDQVLFTSHIPELVFFSDEKYCDYVNVSIYVNLEKLQTFTLRIIANRAVCCNIGRTVQKWMTAHDRKLCEIVVEWNFMGSAEFDRRSVFVQYCSEDPCIPAEEFCTHSFLLSGNVSVLPYGSDLHLPFTDLSKAEGSVTAVYRMPSGNISTLTFTPDISLAGSFSVCDYQLPFSDLVQKIEAVTALDKVLSVHAEFGLRQYSFYFTDRTPDLSVTFRNSFGVMQSLMLWGRLEFIPEVSSQIARLYKSQLSYDVRISDVYEFASEVLPAYSVSPLYDLLHSQEIYATFEIAGISHTERIIIEAPEFNSGNSKDSAPSLKMKFRPSVQKRVLAIDEITPGIFGDEFNDTFF